MMLLEVKVPMKVILLVLHLDLADDVGHGEGCTSFSYLLYSSFCSISMKKNEQFVSLSSLSSISTIESVVGGVA